jgi:hypothetical protein
MVSLATIAQQIRYEAPDIGVADVEAADIGIADVGTSSVGAPDVGTPDIGAVLKYLDEQARPVAQERNPLPIIAPAVYEMHQRANRLLLALGKDRLPRTIATSAGTAFANITDYYVAITGIAPPSDPLERKQYYDEINYAKGLVDLTYRLLVAVGGKGTLEWEPVQLSEEARTGFSEELQNLKKNRLLPAFASEHMASRRSAFASLMSWLFFLIWILWITGLWQMIIPLIFGAKIIDGSD